MNCPYCDNQSIEPRIILHNDLVKAFPTNIPITVGHVLICPVRHVGKIDQLSDEELKAIKQGLILLKASIVKSFGAEGFNIAWNEGSAAGQSVDHLHIHLVPRKFGDSGIYGYEPRQFLYRPGVRNESPEAELREVARLIKRSLE